MPSVFFDSNVLLYAAADEGKKRARVEALIRANGTISVQVLSEIASVARRKMRMDWDETVEFVAAFRNWLHVIPLTEQIHDDGIRLARRYQLSVYDGMIVAAAIDADCTVLYSEDMQNGMIVDSKLRIQNPFLS
ncbi:MAG TPA: PIN domain-containing protein [Rhizobiaceae bacterium]|nr:PIN domain-containing protein [Rhizobiaceae bacterium]